MDKRARGKAGEDRAVHYLKKLRYTILARNFASRLGEIDIVARDRRTLVFIEVKLRTSPEFGSPFAAVDERKQRRLQRIASSYLVKNGLYDRTPVRFDVLGITPAGIEHIQNAF